MPQTTLYDRTGKSVGSVELADALFAAPVNAAVLHQVVTAQLAGRRTGTHDTKTRGEVRGGGAKPYRQKGTWRARQGSKSAPHYRGGGAVFGRGGGCWPIAAAIALRTASNCGEFDQKTVTTCGFPTKR